MSLDDAQPVERQPGHASRCVLFVCEHNAGRSQIAEAFFDRDGPDDVYAESAGTRPSPTVWPSVAQAMREIGIELEPRKPKRLTLEMQLRADWAVTMGCGDVCPYVPSMVEAWEIPDPAGRPIEDVRAIRDGIEAHVRELIDERLELIRTDRTAHELRLAQLLRMLAAEFSATKPAEEIRACADAVLEGFDGARVRSHIVTLAHRQTRECLRQDKCELLTPLAR